MAELRQRDEIIQDIFRFKLFSKELAQTTKPGQFIDVKCSDSNDLLLRRPISISSIDKINNEIEIIFQVKGKGTKRLAEFQTGSKIDILGPLGIGFDINNEYKSIAVVGGGIGIFPLMPLLRDVNCTKDAYLGFRNKDNIMLENEFSAICNNLYISTDDGSYGFDGRITDLLAKQFSDKKYDIVYGCGPKPMLRALQKISKDFGIRCQISLEERMGCGVGACLGCACKTDKGYKHVCVDGPVFWSNEVIFDE